MNAILATASSSLKNSERFTGIAKSRVQTPLKSWIFQASLSSFKNCVYNCLDHSFTWFLIRSLIYNSFHILLRPENTAKSRDMASSNILILFVGCCFCLYFTAWYTPLVGLSCSLVVYFLACALTYYSSRWQLFLYVPVSISLFGCSMSCYV